VRTALKVLVAEDSEDDAILLVRELQRGGYQPTWERVQDAPSMRAALGKASWDIVISDSAMPEFSASAALGILKEMGADIPFVIVSGTIGEEAAVAAMREGASDFLLKGKLARLPPVIARELRESRARAARRKAEDDLRASEARYRILFESSPLPMWVLDTETLAFLAVNEAAVRHYGFERSEFARMTLEDIRPQNEAPVTVASSAPLTDERQTTHHRRKDGSVITVEIQAHDFAFDGQRARLVVANDVTERQRLEEQLRQSQKMDAVGRLAGGVAHDFNNVLSVILSYGDLLLDDLEPGDRLRDDVEEIRKAGKRAAELTRQLLMFSRQQVFEAKVIDLNDVLSTMDKFLRRILGADVDLVSIPVQPLGRVRADRSNLEQVVMNLVVNARDAMPRGGKLTMETANVVLDEEYARGHLGANAGPHVMLAVSDTGVGMDKSIQGRIFEPFFTTKEKGKGTGLGLSTVFGIVQQAGGSIWVYSEPGKGTTFKVYLPRVDAAIDTVRPVQPVTTLRGTETVLLVEDDDQVRAVARSILRATGYQVIDARSPEEAIVQSEKHKGTIHLLLTDVVMPQMGGPELAKRLARTRPDMKVLCTSGYTDDSIVRHGVLDARFAYLQKPITPESLTTKVREVLDEPTVS
jgi:two-component system, cell cycle sensor histidine kinase and response regulator CckA